MWKNVPSLAPTHFIPVSYGLTSELQCSGPAEVAHVGGGVPFTPLYPHIPTTNNIIAEVARVLILS